MIIEIAVSLVLGVLGVQTYIKYTTDEDKRSYRIVKKQKYEGGKERGEYWLIYKKVNLLGIKYWSAYKNNYDYLIPVFPKIFWDLKSAEDMVLKLLTRKPINKTITTIEREWTRDANILNK